MTPLRPTSSAFSTSPFPIRPRFLPVRKMLSRIAPKTTVIITNLNQGAHLEACIESVLIQTHPVDEIIVHDRGSSDHSLAILLNYAPRITLLTEQYPDLPEAQARSRALHESFIRSTGDIIFLLDSRDLFSLTKIASFLKAFSAEPRPVAVQAPMAWIDETGWKLPRMPEPFRHTANAFSKAYSRQDPDLFYSYSALAFTRDFLASQLPVDWSDGLIANVDTRLAFAALLSGPITTLPSELGAWRKNTHASSADAGTLPATYHLQETLRRTRLFNQLSHKAGHPPISIWQNPRLYLQALRLVAPKSVYRYYKNHFAHRFARPAEKLAVL